MFNEEEVTSMILDELQHHSFTEFKDLWDTLLIFKGEQSQHYIADEKKAIRKLNHFDTTEVSQLHVVNFLKTTYLENPDFSLEAISSGKIPKDMAIRAITFALVDYNEPVEVYDRLKEIVCLLRYNEILIHGGYELDNMSDKMNQQLYVKLVSLVREAKKNANKDKVYTEESIAKMKVKFQ